MKHSKLSLQELFFNCYFTNFFYKDMKQSLVKLYLKQHLRALQALYLTVFFMFFRHLSGLYLSTDH